MTALTVVRAADRDVTARRLLRAAWHRHRAAFLTIAGAACYALVQEWLRSWLISWSPVISSKPFYIFDRNLVPKADDLWLRSYTTAADGQVVFSTPGGYTNNAFANQVNRMSSSKLPGWLTQHHYQSWVAYQPHSRLTGIEFTEAEVVLAAAVIVFAAALIVFRRLR